MKSDKHILVVEDDATTRDALKACLQGKGYGVACAANGREALHHLRRAGRPWLILLDLSMPVMDGWAFRRHQRSAAAWASIPVVVLSGESDLPRHAAALGAAAYLPKPVELDGLLDAVRVMARDGAQAP
jgi:CheY-like chemotaxis protein